MIKMTDYELLKRCQSGQTELMDLLIERYKKALYTMCRKLTKNTVNADDLFQDTWVKVMKNISLFSLDKNFSTWLFTICVNLYRDRYRKKKRWLKLVIPFFSTEDREREMNSAKSDNPDPDENVIKKEQESLLRFALDRLDDMYRIPILLYYYRDFRVEEVAEILDIPAGTVKSRLFAGRQLLKTMIEVK